MQYHFYRLVANCLENIARGQQTFQGCNKFFTSLKQALNQGQFDLSHTRCQPVPELIPALFSSNLAFVMAAQLQTVVNATYTPGQISEALIELLREVPGSEKFLFTASSNGHLNVAPKPGSVGFLVGVFLSGSAREYLFDVANTGIAEGDQYGCCGCPDSLLEEDDGALCFRLGLRDGALQEQECVSTALIDFARQMIPIERECRHGNPEVEKLLAAMPEACFSCRKDCDASSSNGLADREEIDWLIMLLALLGDADLEARPFLAAEFSRQNVPWYLRKFTKDCRAWLERASKEFGPVNKEMLGDVFSQTPLEEAPIVLVLDEIETWFMGLRYALPQAIRRNRWEQIVSWLVFIARSFYSVYNRPEVRDESFFRANKNVSRRFFVMMTVAEKVSQTLVALFLKPRLS